MILSLLIASICNLTYSPDSSRIAFTSDNDLYVVECASSDTLRLTFDGSPVVKNGFASWVYFEEIFGRPDTYRAFWWSPDSKKLAWYSFNESQVTMFPIYSPFGQEGSLLQTRYPMAGGTNPEASVHIYNFDNKTSLTPFAHEGDVYYGVPFWGSDSKEFYVSRMPRRQKQLEVFAVNVNDGEKRKLYDEQSDTWVNWIEGMLFGKDGLYMVRDFESGWQQIYYLPFNGGKVRRLSSGENWNINLLRLSKKEKYLWFSANRDSRLHPSVYRLDIGNGRISLLTNPEFWVRKVEFEDDEKAFTAQYSNSLTPWTTARFDAYRYKEEVLEKEEFAERPKPFELVIENDGYKLYGLMSYPKDFDQSRRYPVVMTLYGGPETAYVRDMWMNRDASDLWCWNNGIIYIVVDPRSSGENGRKGVNEAYGRMTVTELKDYLFWADYLKSLPYVDGDRIGVNGFSFGGTTTAMLVLRYPEHFRCGIAGGGVYDWQLYDSHYTERYMDTPQANPDGYKEACVLEYVRGGGISPDYKPYSLMLTHGTGDDNVHFQNTLLLIDALQKQGLQFELMLYPDGMHGYRGAQRQHNLVNEHDFWTKNLLR